MTRAIKNRAGPVVSARGAISHPDADGSRTMEGRDLLGVRARGRPRNWISENVGTRTWHACTSRTGALATGLCVPLLLPLCRRDAKSVYDRLVIEDTFGLCRSSSAYTSFIPLYAIEMKVFIQREAVVYHSSTEFLWRMYRWVKIEAKT